MICNNTIHCSTAYDQERSDITALAVQAGVVWLGTRNGYILILDAAVLEDGGDPLLGLQFCGEGKVRCIIPLCPQKGLTANLEVTHELLMAVWCNSKCGHFFFCRCRCCAVLSFKTRSRVCFFAGSISHHQNQPIILTCTLVPLVFPSRFPIP